MQFPVFKDHIDFADKAVHKLSTLLNNPSWHPVIGLDCRRKQNNAVYVTVNVSNSVSIAGTMRIKLYAHSEEEEGEYIDTTHTITEDGAYPINIVDVNFSFLDVEIELTQGSADVSYIVCK